MATRTATSRPGSVFIRLLRLRRREVIPTILGPRAFVVTRADRALLAVAHRRQPAGVDAVGNEVVLGRGGTPFAQGEVVFVRATFVAMTFDRDRRLGMSLEPGAIVIQGALGRVGQRRLVVVEEDVGHGERWNGCRRCRPPCFFFGSRY